MLEAENRINAIAKDLVAHYVDNTSPNGFKAQGVFHSKLACIRYRSGIRMALNERIATQEQRAAPEAELIARLKFLKTAVVISSDGTNEAAFATQARKVAARLNATDNFCKAFNQDDPDAANTGIAFLIVCDILLTGFDALGVKNIKQFINCELPDLEADAALVHAAVTALKNER